jgi:hypothetical protein
MRFAGVGADEAQAIVDHTGATGDLLYVLVPDDDPDARLLAAVLAHAVTVRVERPASFSDDLRSEILDNAEVIE